MIKESLYMWLEDVFLNQYLLSLGEFATLDAYSEGSVNDKELIYLMFLCATMFTQVTMLNMLIAIMGDVFEREIESIGIKRIMTKLQILADNAALLPQTDETEEKNVYMVVIEPIRDEEHEEEEW